MATPFSEVYRIFNGRLTEKQKSNFDSNNKRKELLENAIPNFEDSFGLLDVDIDSDIINKDLTRKQKKYFALLMLQEFYRQRIEQYATLMNIVTDSTKTTGVGDLKKSLEESYKKISNEISNIEATLI